MSKISAYRSKGILGALITLSALMISQQASAASFALKEQSVGYLGTAYAGTSSAAENDASSSYYNPGALTELKHNQVVLGGTYINANLRLNNATATNNGAAVTGSNGSNSAKPKSHAFIPNLHAAWRINDSFTAGFSVVAPFGLSTVYANTDITRYMATESKLTSISYSPSIAYKFNDYFSIGVGFDAMKVNATLASDINFGSEGNLFNKASGWTYGYHAGILYKPSAITKMGLVYFSRFNSRLQGMVSAQNYPGTAPSLLSTEINLPDRVNYSVTHEYTDKWTAMGEVEWTHWSRLKKLVLTYNTGAPVTQYYFYKNTYRFSAGTHYKYSQALTFKGGLSYEQSPVIDAYRSASLPDANRYWAALGVKYKFNKNVSIDGAYAHLFVKNANIAQKSSTGTLNGNYKSSADIVGVQLTWNFV